MRFPVQVNHRESGLLTGLFFFFFKNYTDITVWQCSVSIITCAGLCKNTASVKSKM